jgi:glutathione S-transferase
MITLYQFDPSWGIPNLGQFNVKVETYLRMTKLPYKTVSSMPTQAPKGKLPYIEDDGQVIADSSFIIEHLKAKYGDPLDKDLTAEQFAVLTAMQRLLEDHLYWVGMYTRWLYTDANWHHNKQAIFGNMSPLIRNFVAAAYRKLFIAKQIYGHGMGRHKPDEIFHLGNVDLDALSAFLGQKPYFMGDKPTSLDASAFGILINIVRTPIESPLQEHALSLKNLPAYCDRMMAEFYPELSSR